jgi:hypothetical protein
MHLYCDGLDAVLRIKALTDVLAIHLRAQRAFSKCSLTQIMRQLRRDHGLRDVLAEHVGIVSRPKLLS